MLNIALFGTLAKNALVCTITSKIVDSFVTSKINNKLEQKKWIRNTKLELFSKLSTDISSSNEKQFTSNIDGIKKTLLQILLLLEDKKLINKLNDYIFIINEYEDSKDLININSINQELIKILSNNIQQR